MLLSIFSCNQGDSFYRDKTWQDGNTIPVLKPYRLFQPFGSEDLKIWAIKFYTKDQFINASHIGVQNGYIAGYEKKRNPKGWFVIHVADGQEKEFRSEQDFLSFLQSKNIAGIKFYDSDSLYQEFVRNDALPWHNSKN